MCLIVELYKGYASLFIVVVTDVDGLSESSDDCEQGGDESGDFFIDFDEEKLPSFWLIWMVESWKILLGKVRGILRRRLWRLCLMYILM